MDLLNRDCIIIKAKQTFVDWLRATPELAMFDATLETVNDEATVLLVPESNGREDALLYVERVKPELVRMLFDEWLMDEARWPDFEQQPFDYWFTTEYHSMVYDLTSRGACDGVYEEVFERHQSDRTDPAASIPKWPCWPSPAFWSRS